MLRNVALLSECTMMMKNNRGSGAACQGVQDGGTLLSMLLIECVRQKKFLTSFVLTGSESLRSTVAMKQNEKKYKAICSLHSFPVATHRIIYYGFFFLAKNLKKKLRI